VHFVVFAILGIANLFFYFILLLLLLLFPIQANEELQIAKLSLHKFKALKVISMYNAHLMEHSQGEWTPLSWGL